jgi:hypothetical protein
MKSGPGVPHLLDLVERNRGASMSQPTQPKDPGQECHTPFRDSGNEASIRVPRMFHAHV